MDQQYLSRALDFIQSAKVPCAAIKPGWVPSACLLIGTASELLATKRLMEKGIASAVLRNPPYGHDLTALWKLHTSLYAEADLICKTLACPSSFDFPTHFEALAKGYGRTGDYSLRYHGGVNSFADPATLGSIVEEIARRERMRSE